MIGALSTSLAGLQSATQRLNVAAGDIVKSGRQISGGPARGGRQPDGGPTDGARKSGGPLRINLAPAPDLVSGVVDLKLAEISYKTSAKALKIVLETGQNFFDQIS